MSIGPNLTHMVIYEYYQEISTIVIEIMCLNLNLGHDMKAGVKDPSLTYVTVSHSTNM